MKVKIDSEIKECFTEDVVKIIRGFEGKIDEIIIIKQEVTKEKEIAEEKKSLSSEIHEAHYFQGHLPATLLPEKVKEAIKEFIDWCNDYPRSNLERTNKAKEIFGEGLI